MVLFNLPQGWTWFFSGAQWKQTQSYLAERLCYPRTLTEFFHTPVFLVKKRKRIILKNHNKLTNCKSQNVGTKVPFPTYNEISWKKLPRTLTFCCPLVRLKRSVWFSISHSIKTFSGSLKCRGNTQVRFLPGQERTAAVLTFWLWIFCYLQQLSASRREHKEEARPEKTIGSLSQHILLAPKYPSTLNTIVNLFHNMAEKQESHMKWMTISLTSLKIY